MDKQLHGLHVLLSASGSNGRSAEELALIAVDSGASVIQFREKNMALGELLPIARKLREICKDVTFIVNDRADVALAVDADGVHLGQDDLPIEAAREILGEDAIIGISTGSVQEASDAEQLGANYIGFGHMFPTRSKTKDTPPKSIEELGSVCRRVSIPVIAIGGITSESVDRLLSAGVAGVAVIGAFSEASDPRSAATELLLPFSSPKSLAIRA